MGQLVYIKAKPGTEEDLNKKLKRAGIKCAFITAEMNQDWLNDINTNPDAHNGHLKPKDRDLTMDELKDIFPSWTEVGLLSFDVAYGRTDEKDAAKYAKFIEANADSLECVRGGDELIKRYDLTPAQAKIVTELEKPEPEPEKLPDDEQVIPDLQGGLFLCKSWSPTPFWVVFGKVERPTFLKTRIYRDELYNNIYKDKAGYAYMLLPLLPINNRQVEFVSEIYNQAYELGLRESFNFIIPVVYGLDLVNINAVATDYLETYTPEEIRERFKTVFQMTNRVYQYGNFQGFIWRDDKKMFVPTGSEKTLQILARCSVLTAMVRALGGKNSAMLMSEMTGRRYLEVEFK